MNFDDPNLETMELVFTFFKMVLSRICVDRCDSVSRYSRSDVTNWLNASTADHVVNWP